jgi:hypothetical protein
MVDGIRTADASQVRRRRGDIVQVLLDTLSAIGVVLLIPFVIIAIGLPFVLIVRLLLALTS